ncbi:CocE/NonD family hydrolase, partial [Streptomyces fulvissimus]|nr:CocE/NonD family hydrolase [Streptomyces microflavus]
MNPATVYVPAPDGTPLATDLCLPDAPGPHPAVVIRTPYGRTAHQAELRGWAAHGFAALAQDVRGRHGSPGTWHPYGKHEEGDGAATVAWAREQTWSGGGPVVAAGSSYAAHCALVTALGAPGDGRPDAVIAAVPALGLAETAREPA